MSLFVLPLALHDARPYANIGRLRRIMENSLRADRSGLAFANGQPGDLGRNLNLVAQMINADFGTRVFYLSIGGFDTHSGNSNSMSNSCSSSPARWRASSANSSRAATPAACS
jgi:hypothetical protein